MPPSRLPRIIELRNDTFVSQVTDCLYDDMLDDASWSCDVIIKCGTELLSFYCHRVILASSSPFLWNVLSTAKSGSLPVIILPDVKPKTMKQILTYIYKGQIGLPLCEYADFFEACEIMGVKGLGNGVETTNDNTVMETGILDLTTEIDIKEEIMENSVKMETSSSDDSDTTTDEEDSSDGESEEYDKKPPKMTRMTRNSNNKPKVSRARRYSQNSKKTLPKLTENEKSENLKRVKRMLLDTYNRLDRKGKKFEITVKGTKLVMKGNKLVRAEHRCAACDQPLSINYLNAKTGKFSWSSSNLCRHLRTTHGFKLT